MTRIELDADTARKLESAALNGGGMPVELVSPEGFTLMVGAPSFGAHVDDEEHVIDRALRALREPGRQYSPEEVREWMRERGVDWGVDWGDPE